MQHIVVQDIMNEGRGGYQPVTRPVARPGKGKTRAVVECHGVVLRLEVRSEKP